MALVDKTNGTPKGFAQSVKLEVGQTAAGYVTGFEESNQHPGSFYIIMKTTAGELISVSAKGNLRYRHKDGDIVVGQYTEITRNADGKNKKGMAVSNFKLAQDADNTLGSELDAAGITSAPTNVTAAAAGSTVSLKERAAKLAATANGKAVSR